MCVVTRQQRDDSGMPVTDADGNPVWITIHESECGYRKLGKSTRESEVMIEPLRLSLPKHDRFIMPDDRIEVTDYVRTVTGSVIRSIVYNMGAEIWFNEIKN